MILAIDQRPQPRHAGPLEARRQRVEQCCPHTLEPNRRVDLDGEHPARCRLAELPGADLACDEACQGGRRGAAAFGLGHQKVALGRQHVLPVIGLGGAGQPRVEGGNRRQIRGLSGADRNHFRPQECACAGESK